MHTQLLKLMQTDITKDSKHVGPSPLPLSISQAAQIQILLCHNLSRSVDLLLVLHRHKCVSAALVRAAVQTVSAGSLAVVVQALRVENVSTGQGPYSPREGLSTWAHALLADAADRRLFFLGHTVSYWHIPISSY